jgi:hypothetical protein
VNATDGHLVLTENGSHARLVGTGKAQGHTTVGTELARRGDHLDLQPGPLQHLLGTDGVGRGVEEDDAVFDHPRDAPVYRP